MKKAINIPLTYGGRAEFMIQNVLATTLACFVHGVSLEDIRVGLTTFTPSLAQTPGRLNFIEIKDFTVLMDFAHNPAGFNALRNFINKLSYKTKTGILSGVGDRRDEDLREMGKLAADTFDKIIIRSRRLSTRTHRSQCYRAFAGRHQRERKKYSRKDYLRNERRD
ncbi:MAG: cyanophycin synthetase [Nocardioidaceae bacterium]